MRGLVKQYADGTRANRGIDLDVRSGEVVAVLGPNGAGKTTFLRQLTTELRPSGGTIRVFGIDVVAEPQRAKRLMGITPQEAGMFESLTVREHLQLFARLKGLARRAADAATTEVIALLALSEHERRSVGSLSGGLRRRILIGLALLGDPPLLVLDEPTTGLDPASRRTVWSVLRQIVQQGTTVVLSTHYMEEAERLSDRIAIIDSGRVIAFGSVRELLARLRESYRLSYHDPAAGNGDLRVQRYASFADAQAQIQRLRLSEYSIARASLEDVYFEIAGQPFREDEAAEVLR
ncbi:MAG TPA: ABC transporter ATP-binding protein [Vicinamibacterales bacterium]|nr:ABC transporter ATP-binding protein [Vicinamibacterales bacterium]